jgi:adenosylcobinamide kinase/adenosylcobinamide-phosphate guanylyltransferase
MRLAVPEQKKTIILILGGARSGKTQHAENQTLTLAADNRDAVYVATGQAIDDEMKARIGRHRNLRSEKFTTIEEPLNIAHVIGAHGKNDIVLIDSIGTWITNHMMADHDLDEVIDTTIAALEKTKASVVLVSDEVGLGIVPEEPLSRSFRDHIGMVNQRVGQIADTVALMVAGLPLMIKTDKN